MCGEGLHSPRNIQNHTYGVLVGSGFSLDVHSAASAKSGELTQWRSQIPLCTAHTLNGNGLSVSAAAPRKKYRCHFRPGGGRREMRSEIRTYQSTTKSSVLKALDSQASRKDRSEFSHMSNLKRRSLTWSNYAIRKKRV